MTSPKLKNECDPRIFFTAVIDHIDSVVRDMDIPGFHEKVQNICHHTYPMQSVGRFENQQKRLLSR